jgi:hypothetical protein
MLTREEWTEGPGTPRSVKGLVCYTDGSRTRKGTSAAVYGQSSGIRLSIYLEKCATVFQAEIYAILACEYEILMDIRPEKYISIFSDRE